MKYYLVILSVITLVVIHYPCYLIILSIISLVDSTSCLANSLNRV